MAMIGSVVRSFPRSVRCSYVFVRSFSARWSVHSFIRPFIRPFVSSVRSLVSSAQSFIRPFRRSLVPPTRSPVVPLVMSVRLSVQVRSFVHPFLLVISSLHSLTHPFIHPLTSLFIHSFIHPSNYPFVHSFHTFIHPSGREDSYDEYICSQPECVRQPVRGSFIRLQRGSYCPCVAKHSDSVRLFFSFE